MIYCRRSHDILFESLQNGQQDGQVTTLPSLEALKEITDMAQRCDQYRRKVILVRRQMTELSDRVAKLKLRAERLRSKREEFLRREADKRQRLEAFQRHLDQMHATSSNSNPVP